VTGTPEGNDVFAVSGPVYRIEKWEKQMLKKDDFDFYYLIICSRGPGSETIVVDNVSNRRDALHFYEGSETQFKKIGACEAGADFNEEGPIIAVPGGTKPLKAIYEWIKQDVASLEDQNGADFFSSSRLLGIMQKVEKMMVEHGAKSEEVQEIRKQAENFAAERPEPFSYRQAYISASLRAFLPREIREDRNPWTSVNGWRNVEVEIPNRSQFEAPREATGETAEQLGKWDCAVVKEAAKRYLEGKLPEREFPGC
jgi:hypothetical protein